MRWIVFIVIFGFTAEVFAQSEQELLQQLKGAKDPSDQFLILRDLGYLYEFSDSARAMKYYRQGLQLAMKSGDPRWMSMSMLDHGSVHFNLGDYTNAEKYYRQSLRYATDAADKERIGASLLNISNTFYSTYRYDTAAVYSMRAIEEFKSINDTARWLKSNMTLCGILEDSDRFADLLEYSKESLALAQAIGDSRSLINANIYVALALRRLASFSETETYLLKAIRLIPVEQNDFFKARFYQNIAAIYLDCDKPEKSHTFADSAMLYAANLSGNSILSGVYLTKGKSLLALGRSTEGVVMLRKALETAEEIADWQMVREASLSLSEEMERLGDYREALRYYKIFESSKDSVADLDMLRSISEITERYKSEKRLVELESLRKDNELNKLNADRKKKLLVWTLVITVLLLTIGWLVLMSYRSKAMFVKQQLLLNEEQLKRLEQEHKILLLDSMLQGEEKERSRVARDLHDGVGSLLSGVKLSLSSMKGNMIISESQARIFQHSVEELDHAIAEMRRVAHNMMPETLLNNGLIKAIEQFLSNIADSGMIEVHFEHHAMEERLPKQYEIIAYRVIQELVNNAIKHASATELIVQVSRLDKTINITVEDNGKGFDVEKWNNHSGMGFSNIKDRVAYINGRVHVKSQINLGCSVLIEFEIES